ncbi:hypothetical protein T492DRAFT_837061 [Pavlovales sp. CCMP2436]|nr:hypothetical protein T492DRAFT_837061 [Pavlovales sp. CCMP2436]
MAAALARLAVAGALAVSAGPRRCLPLARQAVRMSTIPATAMPMIELNDGARMPAAGFGTWKAKKGVARASVLEALRCGYRHIDCAAVYKNEAEVTLGPCPCPGPSPNPGLSPHPNVPPPLPDLVEGEA